MTARAWDPWLELRTRTHLSLEWADLGVCKGVIASQPGHPERVILLDRGLTLEESARTLTHELVHDEYDLIWPEGAPAEVRCQGEALVEALTDVLLGVGP